MHLLIRLLLFAVAFPTWDIAKKARLVGRGTYANALTIAAALVVDSNTARCLMLIVPVR